LNKDILWRERKRNWLGLPWTFTVYSFSKDRIFIRIGFVNICEDEVRLYRVLDVSLYRSFWQRLMGLGTIRVDSSDRTMKNFNISNVRNSERVKERLSELVDQERDRKRVASRELINSGNDDDEDDEEDGF